MLNKETILAEGKTLSQLHEISTNGISPQSIRRRIKDGYTVNGAIHGKKRPRCGKLIKGKTSTQWHAEATNGITIAGLYSRVRRGMDIEEAIKKPYQGIVGKPKEQPTVTKNKITWGERLRNLQGSTFFGGNYV